MSKKIYKIIGKQLKNRKDVIKSRQMVKGVLTDCLSDEKPIYTNLLMAAYDEDVIAAILKNDMLNDQLLDSLQQRLVANHGTNEYCACWAIATWFLAFEKQIPQDMLHDLDDKKVMKQERRTKENDETSGFSKIIGSLFGAFSNREKESQLQENNSSTNDNQIHNRTVPNSASNVRTHTVLSKTSTVDFSIPSPSIASTNIKSQLQVIFNQNFGNVLNSGIFRNENYYYDEEGKAEFHDGWNDNFCKFVGVDDIWMLTNFEPSYGEIKYNLSKGNVDDVKKKMILTSICKGKYTEDQIIHARVDESLSFGWMLTTDSICTLGKSGESHIVPYENIMDFQSIVCIPHDDIERLRSAISQNCYCDIAHRIRRLPKKNSESTINKFSTLSSKTFEIISDMLYDFHEDMSDEDYYSKSRRRELREKERAFRLEMKRKELEDDLTPEEYEADYLYLPCNQCSDKVGYYTFSDFLKKYTTYSMIFKKESFWNSNSLEELNFCDIGIPLNSKLCNSLKGYLQAVRALCLQ